MTNKDTSNVGTARFTLVIPMELSIKLDIERAKRKLSKANWLIEAITEKLEKEEKNQHYIEEIRNDIKYIKNKLEV
jgi:hypothetical protein